MAVRPVPVLVLLTLLGVADSAPGQETVEEPGVIAVIASPGSIFSHDELARARQVAVENQARREAYIRAGVDDDVIVLEPYIVEGDRSLLLARLRRELERGVGNRMRPRIALEPSVLAEMNLRRRLEDAFFHGPSAGAPRDAVQVVGQLGLVIDIGRALWQRRAGDIFRSPEARSDQ